MGEPFTCAGPGNPEDWIRNAEKTGKRKQGPKRNIGQRKKG